MGSELLPVSQDDREAAADAMDAGYISPAGVIAHVRAGRSDENAFVQAFARHGIRSRTITKEQVEEAARSLTSTLRHHGVEMHPEDIHGIAIDAASAFGLTVQSDDT